MASGDIVGLVIRELPPGSSYATPSVVTGGSSPAEAWAGWDFDDTTAEYLDYLCYLGPNYAGGGLTLSLPWLPVAATSGAVVWRAAVRRVNASSEDIDASQTYDFNQASASSAPGTQGQIVVPTIAFTSGSDMDSWAAGELAMVRVSRLPSDAGDNMSGDAHLIDLVIKET
jgi:hypothetical protein